MTDWTDERLIRLFERYRLRYWPRSRRLKAYRVQRSVLEGYGRCEFQARVLHVDVARHPSDHELRATVLHEMVHAVVGRGGHDAPFWAQLEYLLRRQAPITVGVPELGERGRLISVIPARFRRCRRMFRAAFEREQRALETKSSVGKVNTLTPTPGIVESEAHDVAMNGAPWLSVWAYMVSTYGFADLDDHVGAWAKPYQVAARRGYVRGRRFFLDEERRHARFDAMNG